MRKPRIYQVIAPQIGNEIELDEHACRHLIQVLRLRPGDGFTLFNGQGQAWEAQLTRAGKHQAIAKILAATDVATESPLTIHLGLGISKGERMDYAIQKAVELGISEITPLFTRYSMVKLDEQRKDKRQQHWQGIIISACEQCGRNTLPVLNPVMDNQAWLESNSSELKLTLDPTASTTLADIKQHPGSAGLYIGPEGGLSEEEIDAAHQAGFKGVRLGPRVLRTETAVVAALTAVQMVWGDLG